MRFRSRIARGITLLTFAALPVQAQIGGILKKAGIKVTTGKDTVPKSGANNPVASGAGKLAATSKAHPEVFGIKLGLSTATEARAALEKVPTLLVSKDGIDSLEARAPNAGGRVQVPNSRYITRFFAKTSVYATSFEKTSKLWTSQDGCHPSQVNDAKGNCEEIQVQFAELPGSPAIAVTRVVFPSPAPLVDVMDKSLVDRYGPATHKVDAASNYGNGFYIWVWDADGKLMPPSNVKPACSNPNFGDFPVIAARDPDTGTKIAAAGCAAIVIVNLEVANNLVKKVEYNGGDVHSGVIANRRSAFIKDSVAAAFEKAQRDKAASVKPPE